MVTALDRAEVNRLFTEGGYRKMPELPASVSIGARIDVLNSYGEVCRYRVTSLCDPDGLVTAMTEIGEHPGEGVCLDSSMSDCYDVGWKEI